MPTYKSHTSKSASKKSGFRFRWWMGLILVGIIAVVGILVLRYSHAYGDHFSIAAPPVDQHGDFLYGFYSPVIDQGGKYAAIGDAACDAFFSNLAVAPLVGKATCKNEALNVNTPRLSSSSDGFTPSTVTPNAEPYVPAAIKLNYSSSNWPIQASGSQLPEISGYPEAATLWPRYLNGTDTAKKFCYIPVQVQNITTGARRLIVQYERVDCMYIANSLKASNPSFSMDFILKNLNVNTIVGDSDNPAGLLFPPSTTTPVAQAPALVDATCRSVTVPGTYCLDQGSWRFRGALLGNNDQMTGIWQNTSNTMMCGVRSAAGKVYISDNVFYAVACPQQLLEIPQNGDPYTARTVNTPSFGSFAPYDPLIAASNAPAGAQCKIITLFKNTPAQSFACELSGGDNLAVMSNYLLAWHSPSDAKRICITGKTTDTSKPITLNSTDRAGNPISRTLRWGTGLAALAACTEYDYTTRPLLDQIQYIQIVAPAGTTLDVNKISVEGVRI